MEKAALFANVIMNVRKLVISACSFDIIFFVGILLFILSVHHIGSFVAPVLGA